MRFRASRDDGLLDAIGDDKGHAGRKQDVLRPYFDREFDLVAMDQGLALHRGYGVRERRGAGASQQRKKREREKGRRGGKGEGENGRARLVRNAAHCGHRWACFPV